MEPASLVVLLLLLACPLLMVWMMRGHVGHGSHGHVHDVPSRPHSLAELRRQRDDLDAEIEGLEQAKAEPRASAQS